MALIPNREHRLDRLTDELRLAPAPSPNLFIKIIMDACIRLPVLYMTGTAVRIDQLIKAGAWSDAAFAMIEYELPTWKLRHLVCQDGEWLCSLSKQLNMPEQIDETADGVHNVMPLAILGAFIEARRRMDASRTTDSLAEQSLPPPSDNVACCENFA
jgi:hypothetical protein